MLKFYFFVLSYECLAKPPPLPGIIAYCVEGRVEKTLQGNENGVKLR